MTGDISWTQLFKTSWQGFSQDLLPQVILWIIGICIAPVVGIIMNNKKYIIIGTAFGFTILVWAFALLLIKSAQTEKEKAPKKPEEITLLYLFEHDFKDLVRYGKDEIFTDNEGLKVNFKTKEYFVFEAQSKFIGFYIPSSPKTLELLKRLPEIYQDLSSKGKLMVEISVPGMRPVNVSELKFSGRVFIYHEDLVLEVQKRELYTLYEKHGLSPQFRGSEYLFKKKEIREKSH